MKISAFVLMGGAARLFLWAWVCHIAVSGRSVSKWCWLRALPGWLDEMRVE